MMVIPRFSQQYLSAAIDPRDSSNWSDDDERWYQKVPSSTVTGITVTEENAMQCIPFAACVRVIAGAASTLPINVFQRLPDGGKEIAREHPLEILFRRGVNEELTTTEWLSIVHNNYQIWGNHYSRYYMDRAMNVNSIVPIEPWRVSVLRDGKTGVRHYKVASSNRHSREYEILFESEVLHIAGPSSDGLKGDSPLDRIRRALELSMAAEEYGARFFMSNAAPTMWVEYPEGLSEKSKAGLMKWFGTKFAGLFNAHKLGVLDRGATLKSIERNHRNIQLVELRAYQVQDIARGCGVPLHLIQSLDHATNNNVEHQGIDFVQHTLRDILVRIEDRLEKTLLGPVEGRRYFIEHNIDGLLRGDSAARATMYQSQFQSAGLTPNEMRRMENRNRIETEGADELYVQSGTVPISLMIQKIKAEIEAANASVEASKAAASAPTQPDPKAA